MSPTQSISQFSFPMARCTPRFRPANLVPCALRGKRHSTTVPYGVTGTLSAPVPNPYLGNFMKQPSNQHRVALVTGAANRLGAAMARALAAAGWAVVVHHRGGRADALALVNEIASAGGQAALVQADLAVRRQRAGLVARAAKRFGPLTVLVNNASSFEPDALVDLDEALWDRHFAIHLEAPAFLARDFAAQLPAKAQGNIVNIIDERVLHLTPNYFSYTLSKAALWTMTQTMA